MPDTSKAVRKQVKAKLATDRNAAKLDKKAAPTKADAKKVISSVKRSGPKTMGSDGGTVVKAANSPYGQRKLMGAKKK